MNFNFYGRQDDCETCGSPFHKTQDCPNKEKPKFRWKTRQELGLKEGEVPFQFRVEIDPEVDDEIEVARKRALLRLNTTRFYNQMGLAVKAHESLLDSARFINNLLEHVEDEEKAALKPIIEGLSILQTELEKLRKAKVSQALKMEEILDKSRKQARAVRQKVDEKSKEKLKKNSEFFVVKLPALEQSETEVNIPVAADSDNPLAVFEEIRQAVLKKEKLGKRHYESEESNS